VIALYSHWEGRCKNVATSYKPHREKQAYSLRSGFSWNLPFCGNHPIANHPIIEIADAGPDGRRLAANARLGEAARKEGGKSELRRAVCRITSGRACSSTFDGKCHRKHTVPLGGIRVKRCGKSAPPAQQCAGQGKPHTEQDQIGKEPGGPGASGESWLARAGREGEAGASRCGALEKNPVRAGSARQTSG